MKDRYSHWTFMIANVREEQQTQRVRIADKWPRLYYAHQAVACTKISQFKLHAVFLIPRVNRGIGLLLTLAGTGKEVPRFADPITLSMYFQWAYRKLGYLGPVRRGLAKF